MQNYLRRVVACPLRTGAFLGAGSGEVRTSLPSVSVITTGFIPLGSFAGAWPTVNESTDPVSPVCAPTLGNNFAGIGATMLTITSARFCSMAS